MYQGSVLFDLGRTQDTEIRVIVGDELAKFPLAIGSVGEDGRSSEINLADQFFGNDDVSGITGGQ